VPADVSRAAARNLGTVRPSLCRHPTAPPAPQRAEAPGRLPHPRQRSAAPAPQGRRDRSPPPRTSPSSVLTATVTVPPCPQHPTGYAGRCYRTARSPARQHHSRGVPGTERPDCERAGDPRPLRPASVTLSRISNPAITAHPPSPASRPGKSRDRHAGRTGMHAHLSRPRQAGTRRQRGPSVAVRGKPTVPPTVITPGSRPLYVRGHRDTATHSGTR
jgi:hypothetical protein